MVADLGLTEFAPRYPQFLTRMCNLDLFDSEAAMHALRTHPRIYLNRIIIPDSHHIPAKQFLGTS